MFLPHYFILVEERTNVSYQENVEHGIVINEIDYIFISSVFFHR